MAIFSNFILRKNINRVHDFLRNMVGLWILSKKNFYCKSNEKYFTSSSVAWEEKHFKGKNIYSQGNEKSQKVSISLQKSQTIKIKQLLSET